MRVFLALCCILGLQWPTASTACELTVAAASSLTLPFKRIAHNFQQQSGCQVSLHFAASGVLVQQLSHGAPFDLIATADQLSMDTAIGTGLLDKNSRQDFIQNQLVMIGQPARSPQNLSYWLAQPSSQIAIGNPASVPAGRYTQQALQQQGVWQQTAAHMVKAANVRQVLDFVARGEVDAGFVYASDAFCETVTIIATLKTPQPIKYPVAASRKSKYMPQALQFIAYLQSSAAQQVLLDHGFTGNTPP